MAPLVAWKAQGTVSWRSHNWPDSVSAANWAATSPFTYGALGGVPQAARWLRLTLVQGYSCLDLAEQWGPSLFLESQLPPAAALPWR